MTTQFQITRNTRDSAALREAAFENPGFGNYFTDHMVSIEWTKEDGWQQPEILPYGPIELDPASAVLHYGQEIFEGLKAYRHPDGRIVTFRPEQNARRMNRSAKRLALPEIPEDLFIQAVHELVTIDQDWVPAGEDQSLYIRPFMIADETFLGVRSAHRARFMVIASPVGAYFAEGVKPVNIWLSGHWARAGHGGTGAAKSGGNYAASLLPTDEAFAQGCSQVLFTDSNDHDSIDELGGMNLMLVRNGDTILTPALNGNILEGVTRDSLLQLARDRGLAVEERTVAISEWKQGVDSGEITEAFACGTAAVVAPIGALRGENNLNIELPNAPGALTLSLREELTGIQTGKVEDPHQWIDVIVDRT